MSKPPRLTTALALLGLGLALSTGAQANMPVYAYAAAGDVDDLDNLVEDITFFGMGTATASMDFASASTALGVHHAQARGNESGTYFGALSVWSDAFTATGGSGAGSANVSITIDGAFGGSAYAMGGYALLKSSETISPMDLYTYWSSGLPSGVEVVMWGADDSVSSPGPVHVVMTGTVNFEYDTPFHLTSIFGVAATGIGSADFSNTATFGITLNGPGELNPMSGNTYMAAAVPEAHEWALMLAGLGLVGMQARRRKNREGRLAA